MDGDDRQLMGRTRLGCVCGGVKEDTIDVGCYRSVEFDFSAEQSRTMLKWATIRGCVDLCTSSIPTYNMTRRFVSTYEDSIAYNRTSQSSIPLLYFCFLRIDAHRKHHVANVCSNGRGIRFMFGCNKMQVGSESAVQSMLMASMTISFALKIRNGGLKSVDKCYFTRLIRHAVRSSVALCSGNRQSSVCCNDAGLLMCPLLGPLWILW